MDGQRTIADQLNALTRERNIAASEDVSEEVLKEIGETVSVGYEIDEKSREKWMEANEKIFQLAEQLGGDKTYMGEKVADVKYPIIATASVQFSARALPNMVKGADVVKCQVVGSDPQGKKAARGKRVKQHMSYQVLEQMDGWEEEMDQLLMSMALVGCEFKKTYRDPVTKKNVSELVLAQDLVVNYHAKSLEKAPRITHIIELYPNEVEERIRAGSFLEHDYKTLTRGTKNNDETENNEDEDCPIVYLEQHTWYDLDEDGYKEPYIITIHKENRQVVRMVARWDVEGLEMDEEGNILRIKPVHYFTQFPFLPAFDAGFYKMGFGALLAPLTNTVNTTINQLLDAGTLANRQGGFIGSGVKIGRTGSLYFKQGEWKTIKAMGDDLRKNIFPLPVKEPSSVLFSLLGLMLEASKELASQADVLTGEHPKGNVPATTTLALIEQGLKVFSAIYKRIYRSLKSEFKKIRRLNELYLTDEEYNAVIDFTRVVEMVDPETGQPVKVRQQVIASAKADYGAKDMDIIPVSGAADVSDTQRIMKSSALLEMRGQGLNDDEINRRHLEALGIDDIESILPEGGVERQPDPKWIIEEEKLRQGAMKLELEAMKLELAERETEGKLLKDWAQSIKALADAESKEYGPQLEIYKGQVAAYQARLGYLGQLKAAAMKPQGGNSGSQQSSKGSA
jgi:chaperonin GroES